MKTTKIFLFILLFFFFISIHSVGATDASGGVTVTVNPPVDCVGSWGACSGGTQTYNITTPADGGNSCPYTNGATQGCGVPASWSGWSACSLGSQSGTCTEATDGGAPTCSGLGHNAGTNTQSCGTNGGWTGWSSWSACSVSSCGQTGTQTQTRSCTNPTPSGGGKDCSSLDGGNATQSQSCSTATCPTGSISASNCSIAQNSNSCNSSVSWSTTSPWGTSAVTTPNSITVANANSSGGTAYPVPNPDSTRTFYLYNNNTLLGQATANASCAVGVWYGGYCRVPVSGVCGSSNGGNFYSSPTSGYCNAGTYSGISGSGPWTWSCGGSYGGSTAYCSANKAVDGGWSAWSAKDNTPGYTGTQTRTCTNPSPAYGGVNCSGPSTQSYTNIPSAPTGFSAAPSSCNNNWLNLWWNASSGATNYKVYRSGTLVYDGSGTSFSDSSLNLGSSYSYTITATNAGGTSGTSSTSATVSNACTPTPNIQATAWGYDHSDGPMETYTGSSYTLYWNAVANATSCTINGGSVSVSGGSQGGTASARSQSFTLSCTNSTGQAASDSVTITTPPMPTNVAYSCSADSLTANVSWTAPSGYNTFYTRTSSGYNNDGVVGTSYSFPISPNTNYSFWVHTRNPSNGAWSTEVYSPTINCVRIHTLTINKIGTGTGSVSGAGTYNYNVTATATATADVSSTFSGWSGDCNTSGQVVMNSNKTCTANFTLNNFIVSTSAGAGGSISPTSQTVNYGSTTTFTITPDSSHLINSVTGCGGSLSGSTYTTGAITGACTVSASFKAMTGTLTPASSSCVIALNSSSCTTTLSWSTTNPVGTSAVTASGMTNVNGNSGSQAFTVPYSSRTFYLYNNGIQLASASASSSCTANTHWDGSICAIDTNIVSTSVNTGGTISPTSRTVNYGSTTTFTVTPNTGYSIGSVSGCSGSGSGTSTYTTGAITSPCTVSVNFTLNTHTLTVNKTGSGSGTVGGAGTYNYGTTQTATETPNTGSIFSGWSGDCNSSGQVYINGDKVCTATFLLMTGTLTPASSSCIIALNAANCTVPLSWSTTNPVGTSAVTASGMTNVNGNSGSQAFTVPFNSRTFYLYNSSVLLAQASATSSCTAGTSWNGTKCAAPSGTLTASNCTIAQGASSCNTNLIWSTTDPIGTSAVTTPTNITVATANASAGTPYVVNYPSRIFYLYNNAVELKNVTATASCINGTTWDGAKCAPIIITFSAASTDIAYNTATTLNWSVANATTCTASGGWSGARATSGSVSTGNLTSRTTFTLSCTGLNGTNGTASVTVIVQSFGTLTASNCTILPAANKCNTNLIWNTYNPLATSAVTTPTNITVLSANSSAGTSYSVDYGTRDFYLYNNGVLLATATARASCEQVWDAPSGVCVTIPTLNSPVSNTVSALSAKVGATVATLGIPASISARGVCYSSTMQNPGINNNGNGAICGVDGNNTSLGAFTIHIIKILSPNTTYYYRGYATNIAGTGYSPQGSFTTLVLPPEASVVKFKELNDKSQIDYGQSITLIWDSSNAYYGCTMTSNFAPSTDIISSLDPNTGKNNITLKPTKTTVYTLICSGEGGTSPASQVQIKVGKITPTFNEF